MVYDAIIHGRFIDMRSITIYDAEFSYNIRMDERFRDYVGKPAKSIDDQKSFIEWQRKQPGDYYFVVLNKSGEKIGLIGVYNIEGDLCETGREVNCGSPLESMEAEILLEEFCINVLNLKRAYFVTYLNNKRHMKSLKKKGMVPLKYIERDGVQCAYYEIELNLDNSVNKKTRNLLNKIGDE